MKGSLFVVGTPIGNLDDITFGGVDTLKGVAFVLAEDTRVSKKLLDHYEIETPLVSYRDQNHEKMMPKVIEKLDMGLNLALISDAGTPTISDPGYRLVKELKELGYEVHPIPGPDAVSAALSVSGLPTDRYIFVGFLPKSEKKRFELIERYGSLDATLVMYESPNRLLKMLEQIKDVLGERMVCVAKDLTKMHEDVITKKVSEIMEYYNSKEKIVGEYVVLVGKE